MTEELKKPREHKWINVDIGDLVTMPVGLAFEKRILKNGQIQLRNPVSMSLASFIWFNMIEKLNV